MPEIFKTGGIVNALNRIVEALKSLEETLSPEERRFRVCQATVQSIPNAVWTKLTFNVKNYDPDNLFDLTVQKFTCQKAGIYEICAGAIFDINVNNDRAIGIKKNGSFVLQSYLRACQLVRTSMASSDNVYLDIGDYLEVYVYQNSGGALNVASVSQDATHFAVHKLSDY